ncbi:translocase of inner mitochondrial membrane domain containing 1 [Ictidomys tridecemlineatus]|nr:translocase of inner mitochondrial membrane domain containing 1 [Ictidomys tridecemlineatus]
MEEPPPAPPSFFCRARRPSSRVFAAGAVAADSESLVENQKLPSLVQEPYYPESGWDRLRELFVRDEQQRISKELENIYRAAASAGIIGWAYGGIPAFVHAKQRYIEQSQAEIYHNRFDAVQCAHRAATRGFIRYGWRWSWRTAVFVTIFNCHWRSFQNEFRHSRPSGWWYNWRLVGHSCRRPDDGTSEVLW